MLYDVTFKHNYPVGSRILTYKSYVGDEEFDVRDDEFLYDPKAIAVEIAMPKFFKDYALTSGGSLEVLSVKPDK